MRLNHLRQIALEAMLDYQSHVLVKAARDLAAEDAEIGLLIEDKAQAIEWIREHLQDSELQRSLGTQLLRWELATGIALLCSTIIMHREDTRELLGSEGTLRRLITAAQSQC